MLPEVQLGVCLLFNDGLRKSELSLSQSSLQDLVADRSSLLVLELCLYIANGGLAKLFDGVELGSELCKLVVKLRKFALLGCGDLNLNQSFLALVLAGSKFGGELCGVTLLQAGKSLVESVD